MATKKDMSVIKKMTEQVNEMSKQIKGNDYTSEIVLEHDCVCGWSCATRERKAAFLMKLRLHRKFCTQWFDDEPVDVDITIDKKQRNSSTGSVLTRAISAVTTRE
jgi:hypothetical protein